MDNTLLLAGSLIILFGFVAKKFANVILGYADRKAQVDVDALSVEFRDIFFRAGGVVILVHYILVLCDWDLAPSLVLAVMLLLITLFIVIRMQKYFKK